MRTCHRCEQTADDRGPVQDAGRVGGRSRRYADCMRLRWGKNMLLAQILRRFFSDGKVSSEIIQLGCRRCGHRCCAPVSSVPIHRCRHDHGKIRTPPSLISRKLGEISGRA